jgi:nucleotide-binding universal stress UspA family protein
MFKRILLALDESEKAWRAVGITADIAARYGAEVTVEHVLDEPQAGAGDGGEALVEAAVKHLGAAGVTAHGEVAAGVGRVADQLTDAARKVDADLIVMGSRGMSELGAVMLGSTSHEVLEQAHCPVLVVR